MSLLARIKKAHDDTLVQHHDPSGDPAVQRAQRLGLDTSEALGVWITLDCWAGTEDLGDGAVAIYPNRVEVAGRLPMRAVGSRTVLARNIEDVEVAGGSVFATVTIAGSGEPIVCRVDRTQVPALRSALMSITN
jgi:hypothetical protein